MTSRIMPTGLSSETVLIQPTPPLSWAESLWLVRRQPTLRALLHTVALGQRVLTLTQGHPALLELAAAAAVDPARLAYQLTEIDAAVDDAALDKAALAAFVTDGNTKLDAEQLQRIFTAWTLTVATTAPAPARLLLQVLCQLEESDRNTAVVGANWAALWQHLGQPGEPPPLASSVAALAAIALIVIDPLDEHTDPHEPVRYRIHSGVVETINSMTPAPVTAAVNAQLAAWWTAVVVGWAIEPPQAGLGSQLTVRASLAAARYLLRQHDWKAASCLLERALIQDSYSPGTCLATTPLLRRIAEGTGVLKDLVVLGAALRKVDADEAETVLHCAYDRAAADGNYQLASTTAGELVTVLRDQGRLHEALTLANQKIEHTSRAGFGSWTQLSDQGRRLQILHLLGHHEQVLTELPALRAQMAELPDHRAHNDRVNPWNAREGILDVGRWSAMTLKRWDDALKLNREIVDTRRRRGSTPQQIARIQFNDYIPLLRLGRLTDADHLLRECQDAFGTAGDMTQLAVIYSARANLEDKRDHPADAVDLQRTSLHLRYTHPEPYEIARAHHNLADYLARAAGEPAEQRAHRLAASLLYYLTGNTAELTRTLAALASELDGETSDPALPTTLSEIACLVDADDGVRFGDLVITLCPDPAAASHALADFLTTTAA
jgi:hypothetical protein